MKKVILLGFVSIVAVLLVIWGPDGRDLYLLQKHFENSNQAAELDGGHGLACPMSASPAMASKGIHRISGIQVWPGSRLPISRPSFRISPAERAAIRT